MQTASRSHTSTKDTRGNPQLLRIHAVYVIACGPKCCRQRLCPLQQRRGKIVAAEGVARAGVTGVVGLGRGVALAVCSHPRMDIVLIGPGSVIVTERQTRLHGHERRAPQCPANLRAHQLQASGQRFWDVEATLSIGGAPLDSGKNGVGDARSGIVTQPCKRSSVARRKRAEVVVIGRQGFRCWCCFRAAVRAATVRQVRNSAHDVGDALHGTVDITA